MKIRRVIVALDPASSRRALLEAAVDAAEQMEAELVGLFVENQDLLHFAGLPFAREVGVTSAMRRPRDVESMERLLRALAKEAQETLANVAARAPVRWSFRVARGSPLAELLAVAEDADLVITDVEEPGELPARLRIVRAGEPEALRAALEEEGGGILLCTGTDDSSMRVLLRQLARREEA